MAPSVWRGFLACKQNHLDLVLGNASSYRPDQTGQMAAHPELTDSKTKHKALKSSH